MQKNIMSKTALAKSLGIARATLYYHSRMEKKRLGTQVSHGGAHARTPILWVVEL